MSDEARAAVEAFWSKRCPHPPRDRPASMCILCLQEFVDRYAKAEAADARTCEGCGSQEDSWRLCPGCVVAKRVVPAGNPEVQPLCEGADRRVDEESRECAKDVCAFCMLGNVPEPYFFGDPWRHHGIGDGSLEADCAATKIHRRIAYRERARGLARETGEKA